MVSAQTETDHKLVITNIKIDTRTYHQNSKPEPRINIAAFSNKDIQLKYKERINEIEINKELTPQDKWNTIVTTHKQVAEEVLGKFTTHKRSTDNNIKELAEKKKMMRKDIESCQDEKKKKEKVNACKDISKEIRTILKMEEEKKLDEDLKELEETKNDSNRCHIAIRKLKRSTKKKPICVKDDTGKVAGSDQERIIIITEYFKEMLAPANAETNVRYEPVEMTTPFMEEEIRNAANSLRNNKSPGIDNLPAELIKYAPKTTHQKIADMFNETAKTGQKPKRT